MILEEKTQAAKKQKCLFVQKETNWLGFRTSEKRVKDCGKADTIINILNTKIVSEIHLFSKRHRFNKK